MKKISWKNIYLMENSSMKNSNEHKNVLRGWSFNIVRTFLAPSLTRNNSKTAGFKIPIQIRLLFTPSRTQHCVNFMPLLKHFSAYPQMPSRSANKNNARWISFNLLNPHRRRKSQDNLFIYLLNWSFDSTFLCFYGKYPLRKYLSGSREINNFHPQLLLPHTLFLYLFDIIESNGFLFAPFSQSCFLFECHSVTPSNDLLSTQISADINILRIFLVLYPFINLSCLLNKTITQWNSILCLSFFKHIPDWYSLSSICFHRFLTLVFCTCWRVHTIELLIHSNK